MIKRDIMEKEKDIKYVPNIETRLRHNILKMPDCIRKASGIVIYGRRIKSIVFTTDLAINDEGFAHGCDCKRR